MKKMSIFSFAMVVTATTANAQKVGAIESTNLIFTIGICALVIGGILVFAVRMHRKEQKKEEGRAVRN